MTTHFTVVFRCPEGLCVTGANLVPNRLYRPEGLRVSHDLPEGLTAHCLTFTGTRLLAKDEFRSLAARALTRRAAEVGPTQALLNLLIPF